MGTRQIWDIHNPITVLYSFITHGVVESKVDDLIWKGKLPMKIKVFLWQLYHIESIDHIFFACPFGNFIWCSLGEAFGWDGSPASTADLMGSWLNNKLNARLASKHLAVFFLAGFLWAIGRLGTR